MKKDKKWTNKQVQENLAKENQQMFGMMIELSKEIQYLSSRQDTILALIKHLPDYEAALSGLKTAQESAGVSTPETSESTATANQIDLEDAIDDERNRVIGQNGNDGLHYDTIDYGDDK